MNDGISEDRSSLAYVSINNLAKVVLALGMRRGCFVGKCDVRSAYRNIPVHPDDWRFLGLQWQHKETLNEKASRLGLWGWTPLKSKQATGFKLCNLI